MAGFKSQDNIKSRFSGDRAVDYTSDNLFAGNWRLHQNNLEKFDPFISGYAFVIWTRLPVFFDDSFKQAFKALTEKNFKAFSGLGDLTLATEQVTSGIAGNSIDVASNLPKENQGFTLKHIEMAGSPIREAYQWWISGIRDPETGLAHYHGKVGDLGYSMKNHTGELLYIVTDPAGGVGKAKSIEYACYYTNVLPLKIPQDHLNYAAGEHSVPEIDIDFKGTWHQSAAINALAKNVMANYTIVKSMGDWDPNSSDITTSDGYNTMEETGSNNISKSV